MIKIRKSSQMDIDKIILLIEQAKSHLKRAGIDQWQTGYPDKKIIEEDIAAEDGFVMMNEDIIIGYLCISFDGEECYKTIKNGAWKSIQPYAVIHRMAIDDAYKGQGLSEKMFAFTESLCLSKNVHSIKADTNIDNFAMQHILKKNNYEFCGIIQFDNNDKLAFEKLL